MQLRKLGSSDIEVSPVCLGANVFGWTIGEQKSFEILDAFVEEGFNFIDTADVYSRWASGVGGESEIIIGKWMKSRNNRHKIILATKGGMDMGQGKTDVSESYLLKACEASLKRLQTDYIDLYQTHKDDEEVPVEEALRAYDSLIKQGKVKIVGASNFSPSRLSAAITASERDKLPRYQTLQPLYNLYDREVFEKELEALCVKHRISVINFYALAAGFLTGKYRQPSDLKKSVRGARTKDYLNEKGERILKALDAVAANHDCELSTIAIAWLLNRPSITAPIASATSIDQLKAITKAVKIKLSGSEIATLSEAGKRS